MRVPLLDNVFCQLSNPPFRMSIVFLQPDHLKAGHRLHMYLEVTSMSLRGQNLMILMRFVTPMVSYPPDRVAPSGCIVPADTNFVPVQDGGSRRPTSPSFCCSGTLHQGSRLLARGGLQLEDALHQHEQRMGRA